MTRIKQIQEANDHQQKQQTLATRDAAVRHGGVASSRFPVTRQIRPGFVQSTWEPKVCARRDQAAQGHPGNRAGRETCPGHPVWARSSKARALEESQSTSAMAGAIRPAPPWPGKSGPDTSTLICWSAAPVEAEDHHCNSHCENQQQVDNPGVQTTDGSGPVRAPGQPTRLQNQRQSTAQQVEAEVEDLKDQIGNFDGFTLPAPSPPGGELTRSGHPGPSPTT